MTDLYAVFGNPIAHSKSPLIHQQFAKQTQQDLVYEKRLAEMGQFQQAVGQFIAEGGKGLNITVPFKQDAFELANNLSDIAKKAGAVNTLVLEKDGSLTGHNTDGIGMMHDITHNLNWPVMDKTVLILGAGGAVRGVLAPLLKASPKQVLIANRTFEKAQYLADLFKEDGAITACGYQDIPKQAFDLIINATSASLIGQLPPIDKSLIGPQSHCYDMMYGKELTVFLAWAKACGCVNLADGLGMLIEQAAEAFYLWRGVRPDSQAVIRAMAKQNG